MQPSPGPSPGGAGGGVGAPQQSSHSHRPGGNCSSPPPRGPIAGLRQAVHEEPELEVPAGPQSSSSPVRAESRKPSSPPLEMRHPTGMGMGARYHRWGRPSSTRFLLAPFPGPPVPCPLLLAGFSPACCGISCSRPCSSFASSHRSPAGGWGPPGTSPTRPHQSHWRGATTVTAGLG